MLAITKKKTYCLTTVILWSTSVTSRIHVEEEDVSESVKGRSNVFFAMGEFKPIFIRTTIKADFVVRHFSF